MQKKIPQEYRTKGDWIESKSKPFLKGVKRSWACFGPRQYKPHKCPVEGIPTSSPAQNRAHFLRYPVTSVGRSITGLNQEMERGEAQVWLLPIIMAL